MAARKTTHRSPGKRTAHPSHANGRPAARRGTARGGRKASHATQRKVRYAVVGQGYFAQAAVLPAFANAPNAELVALVSDSPQKLVALGKKYGVQRLVDYAGYKGLLSSGDIDAVYIVLPNDLHMKYAVQAAKAGVHVLTEKPMALTPRECRKMMHAAERHGVKLMVGYRLHFEAANLAAIEACKDGSIGEPRFFTSTFTMQVKPGNIRTKSERGGGPLYDIGIYCINAARYLFGAEPLTVMAEMQVGDDKRFDGVEEQVSAILTFPGSRMATFTASFGTEDIAAYTVAGTKGVLKVDPAYEFTTALKHELKSGGKTTRRTFPKRDQVAPELIHFSDCILHGRDPEPNGREGLIDIEVIQAIQKSAATGKRVTIGGPERKRRPSRRQEMMRPPHREPKLVDAQVPHE